MCKKQSIYGIHTVEFRTESVLFSSRQNSMDQGCWKDDRLQENFGTVLCVYAYTPHTELCCRLWTQHYGTYIKACCTQCKAYSLAISMCTVYICVGTKFTMCQTGHCGLISQAAKQINIGKPLLCMLPSVWNCCTSLLVCQCAKPCENLWAKSNRGHFEASTCGFCLCPKPTIFCSCKELIDIGVLQGTQIGSKKAFLWHEYWYRNYMRLANGGISICT